MLTPGMSIGNWAMSGITAAPTAAFAAQRGQPLTPGSITSKEALSAITGSPTASASVSVGGGSLAESRTAAGRVATRRLTGPASSGYSGAQRAAAGAAGAAANAGGVVHRRHTSSGDPEKDQSSSVKVARPVLAAAARLRPTSTTGAGEYAAAPPPRAASGAGWQGGQGPARVVLKAVRHGPGPAPLAPRAHSRVASARTDGRTAAVVTRVLPAAHCLSPGGGPRGGGSNRYGDASKATVVPPGGGGGSQAVSFEAAARESREAPAAAAPPARSTVRGGGDESLAASKGVGRAGENVGSGAIGPQKWSLRGGAARRNSDVAGRAGEGMAQGMSKAGGEAVAGAVGDTARQDNPRKSHGGAN